MCANHTEIINPNANLEIPSWLNEAYFKEVLENEEPGYASIKKFTPVAAIPAGENFTSIMLRVYIDLNMKDGSCKQKKYVLKTMLAHEKGGKDIADYGLFPKELLMYTTYLPAFEALYCKAGESIRFGPKCLRASEHGDVMHFIFEDLSIEQFAGVNRSEGFDMEHTRAVLRKLAEFHAASVVYAERNGNYPKEFYEGFLTQGCEEFLRSLHKMKIETFAKSMRAWQMKDEYDYLHKYPNAAQFWRMCLACNRIDEADDFNVLTHGDFWASNVMCNHFPDGSVNEVRMVDYQLCKWSNPAEDLYFFIILSAASDLRIKHFDHFVTIYHARLTECLKLLDYGKRLPQLRELQMSFYRQKNVFSAFFAVFNHLPIVIFPSDKESNFHMLTAEGKEGDAYRLRLYSNPQYCSIMQELYPFLCRKGIFNFEDFDDTEECEESNL